MISIWVTERAPCRIDVPTQSEPVSPPPMTTTSLPLARISVPAGIASPATRRLDWAQEVHGELDTPGLTAGDGQVARRGGATRQHDGIERRRELGGGVVHADMDARAELHALRSHELEATVQDVLAQLEVGDAVAEETADPVGALEDGHRVAGAIELIGGSQPGRAGPHDGHRPPGALLRRAWRGPAVREGALDDGGLDGLDGHG